MNMIFKLFGASALMFLGVACTSCEKEKEKAGNRIYLWSRFLIRLPMK